MLFGDLGDDALSGGDGADVLLGGDGEDAFLGGPGADYIDGGSGRDWAFYWGSPDGVTVSLSAGVVGTGHGGDAEGDILTGVEGVVGSDEDDELDATGNARVDYLFGRDGDDLLQGGDPVAGDYLDGEEGNDHLRMQSGGILVGGPGADVFELYGDSFYAGEIEDFTKGEDKIKLDFDGTITSRDLDRLLTSEGSVLDLELLGTGFEGFGELALNVPVSLLDASDFIIS